MKWYFGLYPTDRIKINGKYFYISHFFPKIKIIFSIWPLISVCKSFYHKIKNSSFRTFFSIDSNTELILDSGAFGFYRLYNSNNFLNVDKILKIYELIQPNYGVHNDIPIFFLKSRINFNLDALKLKNIENAKKFLKKAQKYNFKPIGVAQGLTEEDYIDQLLELYHIGYEYIGIGGIAYSRDQRIRKILNSIEEFIIKNKIKIKIHVFGVGRLHLLKNYNIFSFDNTTPLNDAHRDKSGKRTYYYILDEKCKKLVKESLIILRQKKFKPNCRCPLCSLLSNEILHTGSALRNHSRAFHNAYLYNKFINLINENN